MPVRIDRVPNGCVMSSKRIYAVPGHRIQHEADSGTVVVAFELRYTEHYADLELAGWGDGFQKRLLNCDPTATAFVEPVLNNKVVCGPS